MAPPGRPADSVRMTEPSTQPRDLLNGRTLFRIGIALVVLSAVFLLRYSIEQGWLGPLARVALAGGAGVTMIGVGLVVASRRAVYGTMLQGGGSAVLFVTAYGAHALYDLSTTSEAFLQLVAVAAVTVALALRSRSEVLAGIGLLAAAAAPTLIEGRLAFGESGYAALVGAVSTALFLRLGWTRLQVTTGLALLASVAIDILPDLGPEPALASTLESALFVVWLMLVAIPIVGAATGLGGHHARVTLPVVSASVGTLVLYAGTRVIYGDITGRLAWASLALALAGVHVGFALALRHRDDTGEVQSTQTIPIVTMLGVATVEGLSGEWAYLGLALLALGMIHAGHKGPLSRLADAGHVIFVVGGVLWMSAIAMVGSPRSLTDVVPGLGIIVTAVVIGRRIRSSRDDDIAPLYLAGAYLAAVAWMAIEFPRLGDAGSAVVTAGWAVLGVGAIVAGRLGAGRLALGSGFATIGLALTKLFFVDLTEAPPLVRIGLFAGIGLLLLAGGYWLGDEDHTSAG